MNPETEAQPTVFHAIMRHRILVAVSAVAGLLLGIIVSIALPSAPGFLATASVVLQDPDSDTGGSSSRFVANQVEVMVSNLVAAEAAKLVAAEHPDLDISAGDIALNTTISGGSASDLVLLIHEAETAEEAQAAVNAVIEAYETVSRLGTVRTAQAAVDRIDAQLDGLELRLEALQSEIEAIEAQDVLMSTLDSQAREAIARIAALQAQLPGATEDELQQIADELRALESQLDLHRLIASISEDSPELNAAEAEQAQLIDRRADLLGQRDQLLIEIDSAPSPVLLAVPAEDAFPVPPPGAARFAVGGLILGALVGSGLAYWLVLRRRVFGSRLEPETTLGAPLIAEVPDFAGEGIHSQLPVRDDPRTVVAEAYRFAATSLELKASNASVRSVVAVSAVVGNGKTTTVANVALALAREGHKILAIDADLGNQELARLLGGDEAPFHPGLSEILDAGMSLDLALQRVQLTNDSSLFLIGRGRRPVTAADLLRLPEAHDFFNDVRAEFDLIIVDAPPLLQVAYSSTLLRHVDGGLVIVAHESPVAELEEVANRMSFFGVPPVGYIYNMAPMRKDMPRSGGSLMDILGTQGASERAQGAGHS